MPEPAGYLGGALATVTLFQELAASAGMSPPVSDPTAFGGAGSVLAAFSSVLGTDIYAVIAVVAAFPIRYFIDVTAVAGTTGTYSLQLTTSAVPIPPAAILFLSALAGLAGFSRIRRRKAVAT